MTPRAAWSASSRRREHGPTSTMCLATGSPAVHNGVRTEYLVDPSGLGDVVAEYDGGGNLQAHYVHGSGLTSRVDVRRPGGLLPVRRHRQHRPVHRDRRRGAELLQLSSLRRGAAASETVANPFKFVGQFGVMREGNGLDYMRNRWYDPRRGGSPSRTRLGLAGGTNLYAYVGNDPVSFVDPSGLTP